MKIAVLMGSPRKKDSYKICKMIEEQMQRQGDVGFEYIFLKDFNIEECRGCELCLTKGEAYCPIKDEIQTVVEKLESADGIIFTSPVYACQISGSLKKVVDRLSYLFHRPKLVGKPALTLVTTAGGGMKETAKYLKMIASGWGCNYIGGLEVIASRFFENRWNKACYNEKYKAHVERQLTQMTNQLYRAITLQTPLVPSFYDIYMFNGMKSKIYTSEADKVYWEEKGWLTEDYYYPVKIGGLKKLFGRLLWRSIQSMGEKLVGEK